ncbi:MAG TPA: ATP-binding protein [Anaeromyxobacteraceae bacterium]|nr:ATP-binding protein [Anaeromyxobacteraceae bacterium]
MATAGSRLGRDACAQGFVRAAQYFANMLSGADVLAESRDLIRGIFAPEIVCFCEPSRCSEDCGLSEADRGVLRRAVDQVMETGLMAMESLDGPSPIAFVVLPISVRGRTETALVIGYEGERTLPSHALEAHLGVAGLVGATLARQRADRELLVLAEERAARAIAEVMEGRARLLAEASKALSASFDYEATLAGVARLVVPQLADACAVELRDEDSLASSHPDASRGAARVMASGQPELQASAMVVPIVIRESVLGAITLVVSEPGRRYGPEDLAFAEEIARRAGTAIENARLYRQAQQAIGLRDEFLAIAAHELKTPLTGLTLLVASAERSMAKLPNAPALMRSKIAALSRQVRRLTDLVKNLLDVSRIQAGRFHVSIEQVDLCAVVREVAERHAQEASDAGCSLEIAADGPVVGAWDQSGLDHIVSNLVSNAIKYGKGKPISVVAGSNGDTARLSVADGGIGIAPDDHERIFQRFERAVTHSGFAGMGLGLWIVREIVTRLGGAIHVESRLGQGACFAVELPISSVPGGTELTAGGGATGRR